jgi:uncharacterized protein (DUF433 family)
MASASGIIVRDPNILGGTPVFRGTRVPFHILLDYLKAGQPMHEFLEDFPTVKREAAIGALEYAKRLVLSELRAESLLEIGRDCAPRLKEPFCSAGHGELLYDEKGLPK